MWCYIEVKNETEMTYIIYYTLSKKKEVEDFTIQQEIRFGWSYLPFVWEFPLFDKKRAVNCVDDLEIYMCWTDQ